MNKCTIVDCKSNVHAKGMCTSHYYKKRNSIKNSLRKKFAVDFLGGECKHCGSKDNLQFDHINRDRTFCIGNNLQINIDNLLLELSKCQLLCKKCHMVKTLSERTYENYHGSSHGYYGARSTHGSPSMYTNNKCRCDECRKAWRVYYKAIRLKKNMLK